MNRFHLIPRHTPPRHFPCHGESRKHHCWMCLRWADKMCYLQKLFSRCLADASAKYFRSASSTPTPRKIVFPFCPLSVILLHVESSRAVFAFACPTFPPHSSFPPQRHTDGVYVSIFIICTIQYLSVHNPEVKVVGAHHVPMPCMIMIMIHRSPGTTLRSRQRSAKTVPATLKDWLWTFMWDPLTYTHPC